MRSRPAPAQDGRHGERKGAPPDLKAGKGVLPPARRERYEKAGMVGIRLGSVGTSVVRKEAWEKVTGSAKYAGDLYRPGMLYARMVTSTIAHGKIIAVDKGKALAAPGVKCVVTGQDVPVLCGVLLKDRPALAIDKVRYFGEPVALVIALSEQDAAFGADQVAVQYEELPAIGSVAEALAPGAAPIHELLGSYEAVVADVYPQQGTNIASRYRIRKGDMRRGWQDSEVVVEEVYSLPPSDHLAMEVRSAQAEIKPDGAVHITTASQSPYTVRKLVSSLFDVEEGKVQVHVPFVGGGFGGKSTVQLEILAYIASRAVGGRLVRVQNTREQDMATSPGRLGLEGRVKLGAGRDGVVHAAEMRFWLDTGAYTDIAPNMSKAIAVDCTGPYNFENLSCDSLTVYTNHNYCTAFRGFSHESYTFCVERALDALARRCRLDPLELRRKNAIQAGNFSPTQVRITPSNTGDTAACIDKLRGLIGWDANSLRMEQGHHKVRAKGMSCLWKTPNPPSDASCGAVITFNSDGSLNLNVGVVEMGSGGQSQLAQMLADRMGMEYDRVHVSLGVNTELNPYYWKTVASMTNYIAGRAVMNAADDALQQIKQLAALALRSPAEDIEIKGEKAYLRHDPDYAIGFQDLVYGLKYPDGNAVGRQVVGRGSYVLNHISALDPETGKGNVGPSWTVGAQAVEVELDLREFSYRILKAATVMDVGKVIDPEATKAMIRGGMSMGLGLGSREAFTYDNACINRRTSLRTYKLLHIGEEPEYLLEFVETPQRDAPFGARVFSEHGIIGMPAALGNALSLAAGVELNQLPLTPESIWLTYAAQNEVKRS